MYPLHLHLVHDAVAQTHHLLNEFRPEITQLHTVQVLQLFLFHHRSNHSRAVTAGEELRQSLPDLILRLGHVGPLEL